MSSPSPLRISDRPRNQAGSTKILAAVSSSRLRVPPFILTIHCRRLRPRDEQSSSITSPGNTPILAILPHTPRSPLTRHTLTFLHSQHSVSGRTVSAFSRQPIVFRRHFFLPRRRQRSMSKCFFAICIPFRLEVLLLQTIKIVNIFYKAFFCKSGMLEICNC